jgi:hypothetical protein
MTPLLSFLSGNPEAGSPLLHHKRTLFPELHTIENTTTAGYFIREDSTAAPLRTLSLRIRCRQKSFFLYFAHRANVQLERGRFLPAGSKVRLRLTVTGISTNECGDGPTTAGPTLPSCCATGKFLGNNEDF